MVYAGRATRRQQLQVATAMQQPKQRYKHNLKKSVHHMDGYSKMPHKRP